MSFLWILKYLVYKLGHISNQLGQLGRDQHQNIFYTQCKSNEIINVSIAFDNHDPNNGSVWYLEGSHRLGRLPIEVDEERAGSNPKNWRNERGKPLCIAR